jgi:hypothetical protein
VCCGRVHIKIVRRIWTVGLLLSLGWPEKAASAASSHELDRRIYRLRRKLTAVCRTVTGCMADMRSLLFSGKREKFKGPTSAELKRCLAGHPAIIGYRDSDPNVGDHALAWDGNTAIDCSNGRETSLVSITVNHALIPGGPLS